MCGDFHDKTIGVSQFREKNVPNIALMDCNRNGIVLEVLKYKGFRAEAKSNKGFGKGWEAEYLAKN